MTTIRFTNANVIDTRKGQVLADHEVRIKDGRIIDVSAEPLDGQDEQVVDLKGRYLMPGLVDSHVHVTAITPNFALLETLSPFYVGAKSNELLESMLMRGFTTVRDAGGADYGLAKAIEEDSLIGPRILYCGNALSQTGGHADMRGPGQQTFEGCFCCAGLGRVCDGVSEVRRAARDEIRKGATQIKIMASGGVSSPTDRIDSTQFSLEEIDAIVEEATAANIHTMAHAYTARAINRLIPRGVKTIEHGNLMDEESCRLFLEYDAYLTPTLATYDALAKEGVEAGMAPHLQQKVYDVLDAGGKALEMAYRHGVKMLYGSDLLGSMQRHQLNEFNLRKDVVPADDLLRAATCNAADAYGYTGDFGEIIPGARADLLVLGENPLEDITVMTQPERYLLAIMKFGSFYKTEL
ncbi:amidohydrolase family protein [Halomonas sp. McH1-25]|uniref:metal-dependent hydrolase family protein n=1 Tax=Halomonas sp. McH1-25 TaxID=2917740 RepID=UPI001EF61A63|nr:amidohydrolase family protein [Halomonas sp. McH1-25]MCG7601124.1 amidohydrolase family protein [Halomonas sp. McH1-25]MCP1363679.1 amidohydrolase family protein [Halomonas sp. BBD48]